MVREETKTNIVIEELEDVEYLEEKTYQVILHNDDVTPTPLVHIVLMSIFSLSPKASIEKIIEAESKGQTKAGGNYTFSAANEKVNEANNFCERYEYKLNLTIEEE